MTMDSLDNPHEIRPGRETWISGNREWLDYFALSLSLHHSTTDRPLGGTKFEDLFRSASESVGWEVTPRGSPTQRFVDLGLTIPEERRPRRLSMKSTSAKNTRPKSIHISKLTEAAKIQDVRTKAGKKGLMEGLLQDYLHTVDSIIMLRTFKDNEDVIIRYELVEIPTSIFRSVLNLGPNEYQAQTPSLPCEVNGQLVAKIRMDHSDAKITVSGIRLDACTVHSNFIPIRNDPT